MNETELLFTEILNCRRIDLYLNKDLKVDQGKSRLISAALKRRLSCEPIQYILGKAEFMGLEFKVNKEVFIPRPETEILVETVVRYRFKVQSSKFKVVKILDLGTGSGCIAVSLAKFIKNANITATDFSDAALKIAQQNARLNNVEINFLQSNLFSNYELPTVSYDLIISNPPYIPTAEIGRLQPEVRYEPRIALDGGKDGLDFYRKIIQAAPGYLKLGGFLMMEMGFNQREKIEDIFQKAKNFRIKKIVKDYSGIDRVIVARVRKNG